MFASNRSQIPTGIWILGFVSLLMDVSSEMIHSLLPLFMVTSLGASALMIGLIEGLAEATALIVKVFSGVLSDWFGRRKGLALIGYGLGAVTKPLFALAPVSYTHLDVHKRQVGWMPMSSSRYGRWFRAWRTSACMTGTKLVRWTTFPGWARGW